ncbi:MAG: selenide, water dikinase SelD [Myxococcota bacterium]
MGPGDLHELLTTMAPAEGEMATRVLIGLMQPDDAAVITWGNAPAVVMTTDIITPACDDPFLFGQLAAANAISDVYAMGGRPVAVLNICCFPEDANCPLPIKKRILAGVAERVAAAGAVVVGGHTVRDAELKVGLAVVGQVEPDRVLRKAGLRVGDALILTKPLGIGVLINAYRKDLVTSEVLESALREQVDLNDRAAQIALDAGATGATDITGFGLCGHGLEMARGAGATLLFQTADVPMRTESLQVSAQGVTSRGQKDNEKHSGTDVQAAPGVDPVRRALCFDPQTSGPLLFGVDPARAEATVQQLRDAGMPAAAVVGRVEAGPPRVHLV